MGKNDQPAPREPQPKPPEDSASQAPAPSPKPGRPYLAFLRHAIDPRILPGITALILILYLVLFRHSDVDIEFNKHGATIVTKNKEPQRATILLPASKLWLNTGIRIKPKTRVFITASGAVNLAVHRLIQAANSHKKPRLAWLGPEGARSPQPTDLDDARNKFLVLPGANYGTVVACIAPENSKPLGMENPRPDGVVEAISKDGILSEAGGILWLCVNDVVLSDDAESAYVATQAVLDKAYPPPGTVKEEDRKAEWKEVKDGRYYNAFFDDNAGEYLIQIDLTKQPSA